MTKTEHPTPLFVCQLQGGVRPVDLFAINSLEIPPFAGCGNSAAHGTPNGCGRLLVNGAQLNATAVRCVCARPHAATAMHVCLESVVNLYGFGSCAISPRYTELAP